MSHVGGRVSPWSQAPLYVQSFDLARWLAEKAEDRRGGPHAALLAQASTAAAELLLAIGLALTFPSLRVRNLERADEQVVRARLLLRLACELGALSPGGLRHASNELDEIGRMIGGWRRSVRRRRGRRSPPQQQGVEAPRATRASCAAGPS